MPRTADHPICLYRRHMQERGLVPLFRVPVDIGLGCPHRGVDGSGGCTFCPEHGSRAQQTRGRAGIDEQIRSGLAFARARYGAERFMLYVQAFTGTLAPVEEQRAFYDGLLERYPFEAVSIGTRPDCLPPAVLDLLCELATRTEVWVELGIQSVHDRTLERIQRGHDWDCSRTAIAQLHARDIRVVAHAILGLPGEEQPDFDRTADILAGQPLAGIKIHNLHIVRGTALAEEFARAPFPAFDEEEYRHILIAFLRRLPADLPVLRLQTDTPASELVAPRWQMKKPHFINYVLKHMRDMNWRQGDLYRPGVRSPR